MDLIDAYGYRLINGVDKNVFLDEINDFSTISRYSEIVNNQGVAVVDKVLKKTVCKVECICNYFEPIKKYWKLSPNDSCTKKRKAIGANFTIDNNQHDCVKCFKRCILNGCKIKAPKK